MNLSNIRTQLETQLVAIYGVTDWDTIQFSMLPNEPNKGYFQVVEINPGRSVHESTWLVGIGIARVTLDDLMDEVSNVVEATIENFGQIDQCIAGLGSAQISDQIQVEVPDTYSQQSAISSTSGYKTAVSFALRITTAI